MGNDMNRRSVLAGFGALGAAAVAGPAFAAPGRANLATELGGYDAGKGEFVLPPLPYAKEALEPHIDAQTMEIHHDKHHAGYVAGLNKALKELANVRAGGDAALVKHWSREVSFHGSGHVNHTLFWHMMAPAGKGGGGQPSGTLAKAIERDFGGIDKFTAQFKAAAAQVEGSGWAWLAVESLSKTLVVIQEEKQQDMMLTGAHPVLGIDVWEHAYYLKYQNKRAGYIDAWMNVANWGFAQELFDRAMA
ncbi:MAG: superoxide dismutase [Phycisphaerales bacterium]|jgi:Fe-Mn family superoxide dismutase